MFVVYPQTVDSIRILYGGLLICKSRIQTSELAFYNKEVDDMHQIALRNKELCVPSSIPRLALVTFFNIYEGGSHPFEYSAHRRKDASRLYRMID